ncbi:MAG: hypothetical protein JNK58_09770 [Phycisphaerae bacterium]|nr:hypothetical protein [Phycisphaerae bacterium]
MTKFVIGTLVLSASLCGCAGKPSPKPESSAAIQEPTLFEGMGRYHRPVSTSFAEAQRYFDQGMVWMFAFNHDEAIRSFKHAARLDPQCAMAWWGVALCNGPHINKPGMEPDQNTAAWDALRNAIALRRNASPSEQALIDALAHRYAASPPADRSSLDRAYADAMRKLWSADQTDADVATLFAESLMDLRPWDLWTIEGRPREGTEEIVSVLERALAINPDHPAANHLLIHAVEASADPARANAAAERLRTLVPASGHLVHMPSHIDVRTGRWALAAESNEAALRVDSAYRRLSPKQGFYRLYMAHNHHFLSYVSMMEGRSERAIRAARDMIAGVPPEFIRSNAPLIDPYMGIEIEALKRFGKWDEILALPQPPRSLPITRAHWSFARGVALAAKGQIDDARREQQRCRAFAAAVPKDAMMAINKAADILAIADLVLDAEIAYAQGNDNVAITRLRDATAIEDRLIYMEPPEWMLPVRHTLGAVLLVAGKPQEAEQEYREDLRRWPENGWSLFGLARALRAQGRDSEASEIDTRFARAWARADTEINASCLCVKHATN